MQYASVAELRVYLPNENAGINPALGRLLTDISNALDVEMGFAFDDRAVTAILDSGGRERLYLPKPGARSIGAVVEDGDTLASTAFELDPRLGLWLRRLDADGEPQAWVRGARMVTVTYTPSKSPDALRQACLAEARDAWRGKEGLSGTVGVSGANEMRYAQAFSAETRSLLRTLRSRYEGA